jgi:hypothetical protein
MNMPSEKFAPLQLRQPQRHPARLSPEQSASQCGEGENALAAIDRQQLRGVLAGVASMIRH